MESRDMTLQCLEDLRADCNRIANKAYYEGRYVDHADWVAREAITRACHQQILYLMRGSLPAEEYEEQRICGKKRSCK